MEKGNFCSFEEIYWLISVSCQVTVLFQCCNIIDKLLMETNHKIAFLKGIRSPEDQCFRATLRKYSQVPFSIRTFFPFFCLFGFWLVFFFFLLHLCQKSVLKFYFLGFTIRVGIDWKPRIFEQSQEQGNSKPQNLLILNSLHSFKNNADKFPLVACKQCRKTTLKYINRMNLEIWRHLAIQSIFFSNVFYQVGSGI